MISHSFHSLNQIPPLSSFFAREFAKNFDFESLLSRLEAAHPKQGPEKSYYLKLPGWAVDKLLVLIYEAVVQTSQGDAGLGSEIESAIRKAGAFRDAYADKIVDQILASKPGGFCLEVKKEDLLVLVDFLLKMLVLFKLQKARFSSDLIGLNDLLSLFSLIRMQHNV